MAEGHSAIQTPAFFLLAGACTAFACAVSIWHIYCHLRHYTEPVFQRYIVRIIFMVPVYAAMSFFALVKSRDAIWFNTIRDVYEAWVIYNFLALCLAWVGGPGVVVVSLHGRMLKPSWALMTCCLPPIALDGRFLRKCKQGVLQFVIVKPVLAAVSLTLYSKGLYNDGNFSWKQSYLYATMIYTLSYSFALYNLLLFYFACADLLKPYKPVPKFVTIKSVVFMTYWQGVLIFLAVKMGMIKNPETAADLQNLFICFEMAIAALAHLHAFPSADYANAPGVAGGLAGSVGHAMALNDVVYDTVHQFAPAYHDYILYSDGSAAAPRRYRTRTFVPTGHEMGELRRNQGESGWSSGFSSGYSSGGSGGTRSPLKEPKGDKTELMSSVDVLPPMESVNGQLDSGELGLVAPGMKGVQMPPQRMARESSIAEEELEKMESEALRGDASRRGSVVSADSRRESGVGGRDEDMDIYVQNHFLMADNSSNPNSAGNSRQPSRRNSALIPPLVPAIPAPQPPLATTPAGPLPPAGPVPILPAPGARRPGAGGGTPLRTSNGGFSDMEFK